MKTLLTVLYFGLLGVSMLWSQTILNANGPGNTYEDINAVLAPGNNVIEVPDCVHTTFGRHIDEIFDADLNENVFRFIAHKTPDNDRCQNFDRQRTEIKTYNQSPDNLKATLGETVEYKWQFKLPNDFQVSPNFTHLHQIKSVGGSFASIPMITLTARKATPDRMELRYTPTNDQNTIQTANLNLFRGHWVEATETITYGDTGSYAIELKRVSNGSVLLSYSNNSIDTWQDGADIARPKWGIYRSLININDLRDEEVFFNNFSIEEIDELSISELEMKSNDIVLVPNPSKNTVTFKNAKTEDYDTVILYNTLGEIIPVEKRIHKNKLNVSELSLGLYYVVFTKNKRTIKVLKCIVK